MSSNNTNSDRLAQALGASRTIALEARPAQGPLGLIQLRAELHERLRSSGGRPTDPAWTLRRVVPFNPGRWRDLEALAARMSAAGRKVSPAQLAAILVERGLADLESELDDEIVAPAPLHP